MKLWRSRAVRRAAALVAVLVVLLPAVALVEAVVAGPYVHSYHERLMAKAREADLIGQPQAAVVAALGEPDSVSTGHPGPAGERTISLDYQPVPFIGLNEFQVWVRGGRVLCVESFDLETHAFEPRPPPDAPVQALSTTRSPRPMTVPEHAVHYLEIVTPDPRAVSELYGQAYGWSFEPLVPELGNAYVASLPDGSLCGIRAPMHDQERPIVRTYVRVTDLDAAVERARELGAEIALPSMEIPGRGRIAIYFLGGIEQGLWEIP